MYVMALRICDKGACRTLCQKTCPIGGSLFRHSGGTRNRAFSIPIPAGLGPVPLDAGFAGVTGEESVITIGNPISREHCTAPSTKNP